MKNSNVFTLPPIIEQAIKLPGVRVDREAFLRKSFSKSTSDQLEKIIHFGPQAVYPIETLIKAAKRVVLRDAEKSTFFSFAAGLPSNLVTLVPAGAADIAQYFAFSIRMAQEIAYIFGQPSIYNDDGNLLEDGKRDLLIYLGIMLGVAAANSSLMFIAKGLSNTASRKFLQTAVTRTVWYPIMKKVGTAIGIQVTKKTTSSFITKTVPIVGGVASGALTFVTFKPMGNKLVKSFATTLSATDEQIEAVKQHSFINDGNGNTTIS
ncbi:hypothetical protein ACFQ4L_08265 [Lapidilactobacillus mulanensis]|uniref:Bacteriochlorophyll 4-vinyl reductase n=1 Tax=Lapidilactobacillus mulanensis TaxID=2485999 RepID=A0ABW4DN26_9LACO|nr:hypothetical protein [Lapidilactobacillus mulanensis]